MENLLINDWCQYHNGFSCKTNVFNLENDTERHFPCTFILTRGMTTSSDQRCHVKSVQRCLAMWCCSNSIQMFFDSIFEKKSVNAQRIHFPEACTYVTLLIVY